MHDVINRCQPVTWQTLKEAEHILLYAAAKPTHKSLLAALGKKDFPILENLVKKKPNHSQLVLVVLDKQERELEIIKINLKGGKVKICQPPCVMTHFLNPGEIDAQYMDQIKVSPHSPAATYRLIKGHLPDGLILSHSGTIAGIPTETGIFHFVVRAKSKCGSSRPYGIRLIIDCPEIVFITETLPNGNLRIPYSETIEVLGEVNPTTFNVVSGDLPYGLTLSLDGILSGTPTATGTYTFAVRAVNDCGNSGTRVFSLFIANPCTTPLFITTSLPNQDYPNAYLEQIMTSDGVAPITFSLIAGSLPAGLTLSPEGVIAGTPTDNSAQTYNFTVQATSACGNFSTQALSITQLNNG